MHDRAPHQLIDELAETVLLAGPDDKDSLQKAGSLLAQVATCLEARASEGCSDAAPLRQQVQVCEEQIKQLLEGSTDAAGIRRLADLVALLQQAVSTQSRGGHLSLPAWVEESTFRDFLAGQRAALEELEPSALAIEKEGQSGLAELRRRIHTLKGEAGVVGLDGLQQVYHALEDYLDVPARAAEQVDRILHVKDWIVSALRSYSAREMPMPPAEEVVALLRSSCPAVQAAAPTLAPPAPRPEPEPEPVPAPEPDRVAGAEAAAPAPAPAACPAVAEPVAAEPVAAASVERDEETVSLIAEFLQESGEGLARADQILMNIEHDGLAPELVNSLFRVFHSIKGVAGFLDLKDVTSLAHTTETLLNLVRQGTLELHGVALDLVFDATACMRRLLDGVKRAVDQSQAVPAEPDVPVLLDSLQAVIEGRSVNETEVPRVAPGTRVGDILTQTAAVSREAVEQAAIAASTSGRRLGEELVAQGVVEPRQVAEALRAQSRADASAAKIKETIKVDLDRVDSLVEMIGELVIVESMVINMPEVAALSTQRARNFLGQLTKITRDLQGTGMRMRMVPVRGVFQKMARLVRDLSRKSGKQVRMVLNGEGTEMDRSMVEQIADPLVHMIRNAVDHGLEMADVRARAGKPPMGVIHLSAYHEGGNILIEVADDGRGLNREAILAKARAQGLVREGQTLSDSEVNELIFAPGFSTAAQVTEISGRGVGMDVVKRSIETMRGRVLISSQPGQGTNFKLILPLTLAIIDGMLVACGQERYIIPTLSIVESIQPDPSRLFSLAGRFETIDVRGEILPLVRLDRLLRVSGARTDPSQALVVVLESFGRKIGLMVDDVLTQQQVVIKTLGAGLHGTDFISGAAILSDGRVGLILNVDEIGNLLGAQAHDQRPEGSDSATRVA